MRVLMRLVPLALVECVSRVAGFVVGVARPHGAYLVERVIRGRYWALRLSGRNLQVGRGVQIEGANVRLGDRVKLYDGGQYVTGSKGWITIGSDTHIARLSILSG